MSIRLRKLLSILLVVLGLGSAAGAQAGVAVFISGVPVQREAPPPPMGYQNCYIAPSAFYNGVWINAHRICEYDNSPDGGYWVAGYWQCSNSHHGVCRQWFWQQSHWVRPGVVEYGVVWSNHPHYRNYQHRYNNHYDRGYDNHNGPHYRNGPQYNPPRNDGPRYNGNPRPVVYKDEQNWRQ